MAARNHPLRHFVYDLRIYDFLVHNLHRTCPDIVHPTDPFHLVTCHELFRHALPLGHLLHQPGEHRFGLLVNVSQAAVRLAAQLQAGVEGFAVLFDVSQVPLAHRPMGCSSSAGKFRQGM